MTDSFWDQVEHGDGCWEWQGPRLPTGYGRLQTGAGTEYAHRVAWQRMFGRIPDGMWVLHHCDNPPCVRPDHLYLGTHADNMADMARRGRAPWKGKPGHWTGRSRDEATKAKIRATLTGHPVSPETRARISASVRRAWSEGRLSIDNMPQAYVRRGS